MMYLKVAIPRPLDRLFDYEYSEGDHGVINLGDWVAVPFGRSRLVGCVVAEELPGDAVVFFAICTIKWGYPSTLLFVGA